jgi:hypothetical protein
MEREVKLRMFMTPYFNLGLSPMKPDKLWLTYQRIANLLKRD